MENIIRGTTPSLILDFTDESDLSVDDIDILAFTIKRRIDYSQILDGQVVC